MKKILTIVFIGAFFTFGYFYFTQKTSSTPQGQKQDVKVEEKFANPKKSAHYETNTPTHASILAAVPVNVVIDFNFDLAKPSSINIEKDGQDYGVGETIIDPNKLSMRKNIDPASPDGIYTIIYKACWPDGSCHDGSFQFAIKKDKSKSYVDKRNIKEVEVKLKSIMFEPKNILVSKGTNITWINNDEIEHYVNTDSHPAHTYYKEQNSKALKKGYTYSLVFNTPGIYPYHCSAHADSMIGSIVVE